MASLSGCIGGEERREVATDSLPEACSDRRGAGEGERRLHELTA